MMKLQGIGTVNSSQAREAKIGDSLVWNYGEISIIKSIDISKTGKTAQFKFIGGFSKRINLYSQICISVKDLKFI